MDLLYFDEEVLIVNVTKMCFGSMVNGTLEVTNAYNTTSSIQDCLGNAMTKKPILEFKSQRYEILITGINWGFEPIRDEIDVLSQFLTYSCTFVGNKTYEINRDQHESFDQQLVEEAVKLIDKYEDYVPTPSRPTPGNAADDVAAVLAGSKPAAIFSSENLSSLMVLLLVEEARLRGFTVDTVENLTTKFNKHVSVVVGEPSNVRQIVEIMRHAVNGHVGERCYWELGRLLGHPDETTENFIKNIKDFGFNR